MIDPNEVTPTIAFIIINWNGGDLVRRAIESIGLYPPSTTYEVVVVDNASTDGSLQWLTSSEAVRLAKTDNFRVIENSVNEGFGPANNRGFAETSAPLLFLLNADAELKSGACDQLIKTLLSDRQIGGVGPKLVYPDGSLQISVWRNPPTSWASLLSGLRLYKLLPARLRGELLLAEFRPHDRRRDVDMLSGAAMVVKREVVNDVGGFDSRFHMYGEDNEWCLRIRRGGWRLVFEPDAVVMHHGAQSSKKRWNDLERLRVQTEASFVFQRHCLKRSQFFANILVNIFLLTLQSTIRKLTGRAAEDVQLVRDLNVKELASFFRPQAEQVPS